MKKEQKLKVKVNKKSKKVLSIADEITEARQELFDYKFDVRIGNEKNYKKIAVLKKKLARLLTKKNLQKK